MKTIILTVGLSIAAIIFAACGQNADNGNSAMNRNSMPMNHNSSMNMNGMNHNTGQMNSNMPGMSSDSMQSSPNAASAPYDLQFIDTMTEHHEGAVRMAEMVLKKSQNDELKKFAQKIVDDQKKENAQMKGWREKWYAGKAPAKNMDMPGMNESMKMMMAGDMKKMEMSSGRDFDLMFLEMMTPHHAGAITMAKEALTKAEHPEIKTLAAQIIKEQEAEIKQMGEWKAKWSK